MVNFKKILCPTDLSEPSLWAVLKAAEIAHDSDGELFLLHVPASGEDDSGEVDGIAEKLNGYLPEKIKIHTICRPGDPTAEILRVTAGEDIDLVVITTNGTRGWQQFGLGGVADEIIRLAPCPVLTINGPTHRWKWQRMVGKYHQTYAAAGEAQPPARPKPEAHPADTHPDLKSQIISLAEAWR
jgi:nucleotide-binding universal stress UspA family protein